MKVYSRTSVSEFLGDRIVYRNLVPADPRLPPLAEIRSRLGLPPAMIPRKTSPEYARVIVHLLRQARSLEASRSFLQRLIYLGDTRLHDGTAFMNLCRAGGWTGLAFIGDETPHPFRVEIVEQEGNIVYLANRWDALSDFERFCRERGFPVDERTAVIVDLDKTAIGARGRNSHAIDQARVDAVWQTVGGLLGDSFNAQEFRQAYDVLNRPEFHPFTADNQDYLTYICLILGSGLYSLASLVEEVRAGRMSSFEQFIAEVEQRAHELSAHLRPLHRRIYALVRQGDPTPFKEFRYNEYRTTTGRMGCLPDDTPVETLLKEEIVVTQEVREMALRWQGQGALLFGLSDKPDEASFPTAPLAAQGYQPIHRTVTHAVGR